MAISVLGDSEKRFVVHGIQDDFRNDGRGCEDYRHIDIEVGIISNTHGSSRLRVGNTELLVGVKVELEKPLPNLPDQGIIEFSVDCSPNATPQFQGRGGDDLAAVVKSIMTRAYDNETVIELKKLCVVVGKHCWGVHVDILVLECGGNLLDAVSIAVFCALHNTLVPKLTVTEGDEGEEEISLPDDPLDADPLDTTQCPVFVTLSKIGHRHVVDATSEEEVCCLASLVLSVTKNGRCTAVRKEGSGSLDPESVCEMIETGNRVGIGLHKSIMKFLKTSHGESTAKKIGFL